MTSWRDEIVAFIRTEAQPVEKFSHQPRLYALTQQIAKNMNADDDVLFAAAWLHDLGVFLGHRPVDPEELATWDNTAYAMQQAPALLKRFGFPENKIAAVVECIATHQPHAQPKSMEGVILRDADILEQLGAVAVLRTVCKIGRDTRFHTFADATASLQSALHTLPEKLQLSQSQTLAEPRVAILKAFLQNAADESNGLLS